MKCYKSPFCLLLFVALALCARAEKQTVSATEPQYYTIHRNGNTSAYIYQNGNVMGTGSLSSEKSFWWILEPTEKEDCYYIKNATMGDYVQSSVQTLSSLVPMGKEPVEFQIKKDPTPGAATSGFYYMASTDQDISVETDGSLGLNFGATGVVAYYIRTGRGNSYWQIEESEYAYEPPVVVTTDYARSIQLYSIPCGSLGSAYLTAADVEGRDVLSPLHYTSATSPAGYHVVFTNQKIAVRQGGVMPISVSVGNAGYAIRAFAYADWDKDGIFESDIELSQDKGSFTLPANVAVGQYRLRIRVTETETTGAEDDVIGVCYDFVVNVVPSDASVTWSVEPNDKERGTATGMEENGVLYLKAEPKGDAAFLGWKQMESYFMGTIIGTEAEMDIPLNRTMRIVALFSPNTKDEGDGIKPIQKNQFESDNGQCLYDLSGRRIPVPSVSSMLPRGVYIKNGKKQIITQ